MINTRRPSYRWFPVNDSDTFAEVRMKRRYGGIAALAAAAMVLGTVAPAAAGKPPKLKVELIEFEVNPALDFIAKGKTKVVAKNDGTEDHELVIVKGDDPLALPIDADGAVDEDQIPENDFVGEIEEFAAGKTKKKTFKLPTGKYVLFCNITEEEDDGEIVSHFAEGMYTTIDTS
jgi:hypothetical protein